MNKFKCVFFLLGCISLASTSFAATESPSPADKGCIEEACLSRVVMNLSQPPQLAYFSVNLASDHGFRIETASTTFREYYAAIASFMGQYEVADKIYPVRGYGADPARFGYLDAKPANDVIRTLARNRRAVFINESHARPRTRAAIYTLLNALHEEGYNYLGIEGLTVKPSDPSKTCSNASLADADLISRGYPIRGTGFYLREPIFGEIIREAIRLKFKLVAYEDSDIGDNTIEGREQKQAKNLACIFKSDPRAKLLVIAGFSHIAKSKNHHAPNGLMAARFMKITGINPLSIDTTTLLDLLPDSIHLDQNMLASHPSQGYALADSNGHFYGSDDYDLILFLPEIQGRSASGPSWLDLDGARKRRFPPTSHCKNTFPCLIEAFPENEISGIPADSCVVMTGQDACSLFLPTGTFRINYSDASLHELESITVPDNL